MRTWLLVGMFAMASCSVFAKDNPEYCATDAKCTGGATCDPLLHHCIGGTAGGLTLTSVDPPLGPAKGGVQLTLHGSGFAPGLTVKINSLDTDMAMVAADGSAATVTLPKSLGTCGPVNVQVQNPDGRQAASMSLFRYKLSTMGWSTPTTPTMQSTSTDLVAVPTGLGYSDLVLTNPSATPVELLSNRRDGSFSSALLPGAMGSYTQVYATKLYRTDPLTGLITAGAQGISAWTNNNRSFTETVGPSSMVAANSIGPIDVDGDGTTDLVTSNSTTAVTALKGVGDPTYAFISPKVVTLSSKAGIVAAADLDGDGFGDFAVTQPIAGQVAVYFGQSNFDFSVPVIVSAPSSPGPIVVADVNGDGRPDLLVGVANGLTVIVNRGGRTFAPAVNIVLGLTPTVLQAADFDCDGLPEVVYTQTVVTGAGFFIRSNTGSSLFYDSPDVPINVAGPIFKLVPTNLNSDGLVDIAVFYHDLMTQSKVGVFLNAAQ